MSSHSFQPRMYIPPNPGELPDNFTPLAEEILSLRERWRIASEQAAEARQALRDAPEAYRAAVVEAAKAGQDVNKVPDPRPEANSQLQLRELAEAAIGGEVVAKWQQLWNAVASDHDAVMAYVDKPADALTKKVMDLEAQLAQARAELGASLGVRRWVLQRQRPCDTEWARRHGARPQPIADADASTLPRLRRDEAKAQAQREAEADMQRIAKQRAAEAEARYAEQRAAQAKRREAARLR